MNNKSILVIDTPKNCNQCCCGYDSYGETDLCAITNKSVTKYYYGECRPDWCPLSPIPERKDLKSYCNGKEVLGLNNVTNYVYAQGWNDFRDKLMEAKK